MPFFRPKWISIHGTSYKTGCVLWVDHNEREAPRFAVLKTICIVERKLHDSCFVIEALNTVGLDKHFNAYEVNNIGTLATVRQHQLVYPFPLHLITVKDGQQVKTYVCPKFQVPT